MGVRHRAPSLRRSPPCRARRSLGDGHSPPARAGDPDRRARTGGAVGRTRGRSRRRGRPPRHGEAGVHRRPATPLASTTRGSRAARRASFSADEAGAILGSSVASVESALARARRALDRGETDPSRPLRRCGSGTTGAPRGTTCAPSNAMTSRRWLAVARRRPDLDATVRVLGPRSRRSRQALRVRRLCRRPDVGSVEGRERYGDLRAVSAGTRWAT